jgi:hypothetical protein
MADRHPLCPIDRRVAWALVAHDAVGEHPPVLAAEGEGLEAGLRRLWSRTLADGVDDAGRPGRARFDLRLDRRDQARYVVALPLGPEHEAARARLRAWAGAGASGVVLLDALGVAHASQLLASTRWAEGQVDLSAEAVPVLVLASALEDMPSLVRALKPKH